MQSGTTNCNKKAAQNECNVVFHGGGFTRVAKHYANITKISSLSKYTLIE